MRRVKLLAEMVPTKPAQIIEEVWEIQKNREDARDVLLASEERWKENDHQKPQQAESPVQENKFWSIKDAKGTWKGPYSLEELLFLPFFTPLISIKNQQEGIVAQAREFPQIRDARLRILKKKHIDPEKQNQCPRCRVALRETFYE